MHSTSIKSISQKVWELLATWCRLWGLCILCVFARSVFPVSLFFPLCRAWLRRHTCSHSLITTSIKPLVFTLPPLPDNSILSVELTVCFANKYWHVLFLVCFLSSRFCPMTPSWQEFPGLPRWTPIVPSLEEFFCKNKHFFASTCLSVSASVSNTQLAITVFHSVDL